MPSKWRKNTTCCVTDEDVVDPNLDSGEAEPEPVLEPVVESHFTAKDDDVHYDMAFVFRNPDDPKGSKLNESKEGGETQLNYRHFISTLSKNGVCTHPYLSVQKDEVYVLVGASVKRLKEQADVTDHKVLFDEAEVEKATNAYFTSKYPNERLDDGTKRNIGVLSDSRFRKFEYLYGTYDTQPNLQDLYKKSEPGSHHPFTATDRIKLVESMVKGEVWKGGSDIDIDSALEAKIECTHVEDVDDKYGTYGLMSYFPLHDAPRLNKLYKNWFKWLQWPSDQPVDELRSYLGEKAGLYFGYLCHYTSWLYWLMLAGLVVCIDLWIEWSTEGSLVPFFAVFVSIWAVLMLEAWKNKEATYAMKWGMSDYEDTEADRPEFKGQEMWSPINGEIVNFYEDTLRNRAERKSYVVVILMMILVLCCIAGTYVLKVAVSPYPYVEDFVPTTVQAIVILILDGIYRQMAKAMTDNENHQTDTKYEDSLVTKLYLFSFVNSYACLFFIAFVQGYTEMGCEKGSCMDYLAYSMVIIFGMNVVVGNLGEIIPPILAQRAKMAKESEGASEGTSLLSSKLSEAELQFTLSTYNPVASTIEDYTTINVEFGYVCLFAVAFPAAPFFAYASEYFQIRTDGWKLCRAFKRCMPIGGQDIGIWMSIFTITAYAGVLTNSAIVFFVDDSFVNALGLKNYQRVWFFLVFQYAIIGVMTAVAIFIDDVPEDVEVQVARGKFLNNILIRGVIQEDDRIDGMSYGVAVEPNEVTFKTLPDHHFFKNIEESLFNRDTTETRQVHGNTMFTAK